MSARFSLNFVFAVWWKTSSSATFCIFIAINLAHIGLAGEAFRSIWLIDKKTKLVNFFFTKSYFYRPRCFTSGSGCNLQSGVRREKERTPDLRLIWMRDQPAITDIKAVVSFNFFIYFLFCSFRRFRFGLVGRFVCFLATNYGHNEFAELQIGKFIFWIRIRRSAPWPFGELHTGNPDTRTGRPGSLCVSHNIWGEV